MAARAQARWWPLAAGLAAAGALGDAPIDVHGLRMSAELDRLRIVLDLSGPVRCRPDWRERPTRLELRCSDAVARAFDALPAPLAPIERIDHRQLADDELLMRFHMPQRLEVAMLHLPPSETYAHYRLALDLSFDAPRAPRRAPGGPPARTPVTVAIDAGHGGKDPGSTAGSLREADIVLDIAKRAARLFDSAEGYRSYLVREHDEFLALNERLRRSRRRQADLFLSIHADSIRHRRPTGSAVYIQSTDQASSAEAQFLAERANRETLIPGVSLDEVSRRSPGLESVLVNLAGQHTRARNAELGKALLRSLSMVNPLHKKRVEAANFRVLRAPDIPSALIEVGFLSNPAEARRLRTAAHRQRLASALFDGVDDYVRAHASYGLAPRPKPRSRRYVVRAGDTLFGLSRRFDASPDEISRMNGLISDALKIGQPLRVPAR